LDGSSRHRQMLRIRHDPCNSPVIALAGYGENKPQEKK
jgi:hypothetical protein